MERPRNLDLRHFNLKAYVCMFNHLGRSAYGRNECRRIAVERESNGG